MPRWPPSPAIWDAVMAAGAPRALRHVRAERLRVEKGYRAWKGDLSTDYTLLQGGLERFIDWNKDFRGKAALQAEKQAG
jgi:dimethylglycine dehydrogenase